jgi:hypothetical protein
MLTQGRLHEAGTRVLLIFVLVVDTLRELTRVGSIANGAVLPFLIRHQLAFEVEGVVDVGEAELDVWVLGEPS